MDVAAFIGDTVKAENVINRILAKVRQLENFPASGRKQATQTKRAYRYLVASRYKIIYSHREDTAYIHTVFNTRQDPGKIRI